MLAAAVAAQGLRQKRRTLVRVVQVAVAQDLAMHHSLLSQAQMDSAAAAAVVR